MPQTSTCLPIVCTEAGSLMSGRLLLCIIRLRVCLTVCRIRDIKDNVLAAQFACIIWYEHFRHKKTITNLDAITHYRWTKAAVVQADCSDLHSGSLSQQAINQLQAMLSGPSTLLTSWKAAVIMEFCAFKGTPKPWPGLEKVLNKHASQNMLEEESLFRTFLYVIF